MESGLAEVWKVVVENSLLSGRREPGKIAVCSCDATVGGIAASFTSIGHWSNACERLGVLVSEWLVEGRESGRQTEFFEPGSRLLVY